MAGQNLSALRFHFSFLDHRAETKVWHSGGAWVRNGGRLEVLFDGFEGEEEFFPGAEAGFDGGFALGEVFADDVEAVGVVLEDDAEGFFGIGAEGAGEGAAGVEEAFAEVGDDGFAGVPGGEESA